MGLWAAFLTLGSAESMGTLITAASKASLMPGKCWLCSLLCSFLLPLLGWDRGKNGKELETTILQNGDGPFHFFVPQDTKVKSSLMKISWKQSPYYHIIERNCRAYGGAVKGQQDVVAVTGRYPH